MLTGNTMGETKDSAVEACAPGTLQLKKGDRAVLCFEPGPAFFAALWACFAVGLIAVPVCPPDPFAPQSDAAKKLKNIISDCKPASVLTSSTYYQVS